MQLRPRLFLEGNLFVDLQPGIPGARRSSKRHVIPLEQTSSSVQFDQVLTTLQAPVREDLQVFLEEFGDALCDKTEQQPRAASGLRVEASASLERRPRPTAPPPR